MCLTLGYCERPRESLIFEDKYIQHTLNLHKYFGARSTMSVISNPACKLRSTCGYSKSPNSIFFRKIPTSYEYVMILAWK